jgi:predicted anti-sigma-YlaC factor YlaD
MPTPSSSSVGPAVTWRTEVDCSEILDQLADYLDEDAREELCRAIEAHLERCHDCRVEVDTVRKTIVLYQNERHVPVPSTATARLMAALSNEYGSGGSSAGL